MLTGAIVALIANRKKKKTAQEVGQTSQLQAQIEQQTAMIEAESRRKQITASVIILVVMFLAIAIYFIAIRKRRKT